jgi:type IV pilus assembly protein PilO
MSFIDDLNSLDPNNPGILPLPFQIILVAIVFVGILVGAYYYDTSDQMAALAKEESKELDLKKVFESKQKKAANLDALTAQLKEMKQSFGDMLRQLPDETEVAGLIVDISQTGLAAGLEFDLFQPQKEHQAEFYSELPVNIKVRGTYHQLGEFVSGIAALPRIVTTHDININKAKGDILSMTAVAKTYKAIKED